MTSKPYCTSLVLRQVQFSARVFSKIHWQVQSTKVTGLRLAGLKVVWASGELATQSCGLPPTIFCHRRNPYESPRFCYYPWLKEQTRFKRNANLCCKKNKKKTGTRRSVITESLDKRYVWYLEGRNCNNKDCSLKIYLVFWF